MARLRNTQPLRPSTTDARNERPALKEKTNTSRQYSDDGDTEGLVTDAKRATRRTKETQKVQLDYVMTGALAVDEGVEECIGTAMENVLAKNESRPKPNKRPLRTVKKLVSTESQHKVIEGLKQRMAATANTQRTRQSPILALSADLPASPQVIVRVQARPQRSEDATLQPAVPGISPSSVTRPNARPIRNERVSIVQPSSVLRPHPTPAIEASMLALKNFKRRPRQPSMLAMVQQRTTSARPSIANALDPDDFVMSDHDSDLDIEVEDDDEFAPDAEGTPMRSNGARPSFSMEAQALARADGSGKRKPDPVNGTTMHREKRQKHGKPMDGGLVLTSIDSQGSQPPESRHPQSPASISEVQVIHSPSASRTQVFLSRDGHDFAGEDLIIPSTEPELDNARVVGADQREDQDRHNDILDGTMAEPDSSSPPLRIPPATQTTDYQADPASQITPQRPAKQTRKRTKPVSTAILQSLLPKRRRRVEPRSRKTEYDLMSQSEEETTFEASPLGDDEDELGDRTRRKTKTTVARGRNTRRGRPSKATITRGKTAETSSRRSAAATHPKPAQRTYGKSVTSNGGNDTYDDVGFEDAEESTLPEISMSMLEAAQTKELQDAKRKFAEVDEWDMEFESMSVEDHRSSSLGWR